MMLTAVSPIEIPINSLLTKDEASACRTGEAALSYRVPNTHADTMKTPKPAASMAYSRQWSANACRGANGSPPRAVGAVAELTTAGAGCADSRYMNIFACDDKRAD